MRTRLISLSLLPLLSLLLAAVAPGCREPKLSDGFLCSPAPGNKCPSPFRCFYGRCYRNDPAGAGGASGSSAGGASGSGASGASGSGARGGSGSGADGGIDVGADGGSDSGVVVPPRSVVTGQPCSANDNCASGACKDDVCCENACTGACQACAETYTGMANGTCSAVKAGMDPHDSCEPGTPESCGNDGTCDGAGACRKYGSNQICGQAVCNGTTFSPARTCNGSGTCGAATGVPCGAFACTTSGCAQPCTADAVCGAGSYCASQICRAKKTDGDACGEARECGSGRCIDSVCCANDCAGSCMACSETLTGQRNGSCAPVQAGKDPDDNCPTDPPAMCGRDGTCDGSGACRKYDSSTRCADAACAGALFTGERTCKAGVCTGPAAVDCQAAMCTAQGCRQGCTLDTECATNSYCANMTCLARKANGATCSVGNECTSRACVDGVCCESSCAAKCYACSSAKTGQANGRCVAITVGTNTDDECAPSATDSCGQDGFCDGATGCRRWARGTPCAVGMCNATGNYVPARTCDGAGICEAATPDVCTPNVCTLSGCSRTCASNLECVGTTYCMGTMCAAKKSQGTTCAMGFECLSGYCTDGVCCDGPCTDKCNACAMAKTGQTNGHCAPVPSGQDPDNECAPDAANFCGLDGTCNGSNNCRVRPLNTTCGTASCVVSAQGAATVTPTGTCDGISVCRPGSAQACANGFTCASATACKVAPCAANTDCAAGNFCSSGSCVPKRGTGVDCTSGGAASCASGFCVDNVCCSTACTLAAAGAGACQGCANAATGMPNGTCAQRTSAATRACSNTCVNLQTDPLNCGACASTCSTTGLPAGSARACIAGTCGAACTTAGNRICTADSGVRSCTRMIWGFESGDGSWNNSAEVNSSVVSTPRHGGSASLRIGQSSDLSYPSSVNVLPCQAGSDNGTMDVRGKTFSAWINVPSSTSSYANTSCRLRAVNTSFQATVLPASATKAPVVPGAWFQLTAVFPSTTLEGAISSIYVDCTLPADWTFGDSNDVWYLDDVRID